MVLQLFPTMILVKTVFAVGVLAGLDGIFKLIKTTQINSFEVDGDVSCPFSFGLGPRYPVKPAGVSGNSGCISAVDFVWNITKIFKPIIQIVAINMVNAMDWIISSLYEPNQMMSLCPLSIDQKLSSAMSGYGSGLLTSFGHGTPIRSIEHLSGFLIISEKPQRFLLANFHNEVLYAKWR